MERCHVETSTDTSEGVGPFLLGLNGLERSRSGTFGRSNGLVRSDGGSETHERYPVSGKGLVLVSRGRGSDPKSTRKSKLAGKGKR